MENYPQAIQTEKSSRDSNMMQSGDFPLVRPQHGWKRVYQQRLESVVRTWIPPGLRVLEIGCRQGDLLASLQPLYGVGMDFSGEMVEHASERHPELHFKRVELADLSIREIFDVIVLSDLPLAGQETQIIFKALQQACIPDTRLFIYNSCRLWHFLARLQLIQTDPISSPIYAEDLENLLQRTGFEKIRSWREMLFPFPVPVIEPFCNRFLAKLSPLSLFGLTEFCVARPKPQLNSDKNLPLVSVIIPARNEAGNISAIFDRLPRMGTCTELVFVEGHSQDQTYRVIEHAISVHPEWKCQLLKQIGSGKADAVRLGFIRASGDLLIILDADLAVPPEELLNLYDALVNQKGEIINGVRFVYPLEKRAMSHPNRLMNKFFSLALSWLIGQKIKDSLCGTKALWKKDYDRIAAIRTTLADFDPFGDFDLLLGAARFNLKIFDLPVHYRGRTYGKSNVRRWKHGWLLLKMILIAAGKLKFR